VPAPRRQRRRNHPAVTEVRRPDTGGVRPATVDDRGDASRARLLRDGLRLSFQATGGPFRSFAKIASPPQLSAGALMMATAQTPRGC